MISFEFSDDKGVKVNSCYELRTAEPGPKKRASKAEPGAVTWERCATAGPSKLRKSSSGDLSKAKAKSRGKKKVDELVPGAGAFKVYQAGDAVRSCLMTQQDYDVKLNQTNVKGNNNK